MAGTTGTKIVTDGLVLCLDAANIKSYPGVRSNPIIRTWYDVTKGDVWLDTDCNGIYSEDPETTGFSGFLFDGIGDYFEQFEGFGVANSDTTTNIGGDVTAETWFKISALPASGYVRLFGRGQTNRLYALWYSPTTFLYQRIQSGVSTMNCEYTSTPELNKWYHMMGTSSGTSDHKLYLNGIQVQTDATSVSVPTVAGNVKYRIGVFGGFGSGSNYHNGYIANVKLYNRALSAEEVLQNFNAHRGRFGI